MCFRGHVGKVCTLWNVSAGLFLEYFVCVCVCLLSGHQRPWREYADFKVDKKTKNEL